MSQQLGVPKVKSDLDLLAVTVGDWIIRHHGEIRTLEPIVNGLAVMANELHEPSSLEAMAAFMDQVIKATTTEIIADADKTDSGRPWRVMQLNRAIVATRSHNTELMARVFDELIQSLPEDASEFFREGMRQMGVVDYPARVRAVMNDYFQALAQHALH
jgi:phosphoketolase